MAQFGQGEQPMHFDSDVTKLAFQRMAFGSQSLAAGAHSVASSFDASKASRLSLFDPNQCLAAVFAVIGNVWSV
jgi:hypothetical protein